MKRKRVNKKGKPKALPQAAHRPPSTAEEAIDDGELDTQASIDSREKSEAEEDDDAGDVESSDDQIDAGINNRHRTTNNISSKDSEPARSVESEVKEKEQLSTTPVVKHQLVFNRVKVKLKTSQPRTPPSVQQIACPGEQSGHLKDTANDNKVDKCDDAGVRESSKASSETPATAKEDSARKEETKSIWKPNNDKQELDSALTIITKIMKMDAAEPFNVPVNPEALGIPDYFEVIDTPMDFGTICANLEAGKKYRNSVDVYKDVQFIWENCSKYNSKGAYILDLMRRVKKNFMKYWTAAGLYTEPNTGSSGTEGGTGEDSLSTLANVKAKKVKKRHGRRHKSDCLCAICVLKRRRREREKIEQSDRRKNAAFGNEDKQEDSFLIESPGADDVSSNMDESQNADSDQEVEGQEVDLKEEAKKIDETMDEKHEGDDDNDDEDEENDADVKKRKTEIVHQSSHFQNEAAKDSQVLPPQSEEANAIISAKKKLQESVERERRGKLYEHFDDENPMILDLCRALFPRNHGSVWSGPHSLAPYPTSLQRSSIHDAMDTLIN